MKRFADLTPREKRLLGIGGAALMGLALWLYAWQPLVARQAAQQDRMARYLAILDIVAQAPADGTARTCAGNGGLAPRVVDSAEQVGILLARLDPEGPRLRITVAETRFEQAIAWISELETRACTSAVAVDMTRLTAPGMVSLRITLEDIAT